jgi:tRNA pseudouridine38-40 synthase
VRYDGTDFAGWQIQPGERTAQGEIESKLALIAGGTPVRIMSAGRTDAGVHALGQVISFDWPSDVPLERVRRSLSQMLGPAIRIESLEPAADDFHATYSAVSKTYAYAICVAREPDPFTDRYAWTVKWDLDRNRIRDLAQRIVGEHDFAGFCSAGGQAETTVRTIHSIEIVEGPVVGPCIQLPNASKTTTPPTVIARSGVRDEAISPTDDTRSECFHIRYTGNGFLYKMVRNLTGTIAEIARGALPDSAIEERLRAPMPYSGFTAPAKGLFLMHVDYNTPIPNSP